jgi:hypothetical protein
MDHIKGEIDGAPTLMLSIQKITLTIVDPSSKVCTGTRESKHNEPTESIL